MTKIRYLLFLLLLALPLRAQTPVTVSGNLSTLGNGPGYGRSTFLRFTLKNYGASQPFVTNTNGLVSASLCGADPCLDMYPSNTGVIAGQLWGNDVITPPNTYYQVCTWVNGASFRCQNYLITGTTWNYNTAAQVNPPPVPPAPFMPIVANPVGNQNIFQPPGTWLFLNSNGQPVGNGAVYPVVVAGGSPIVAECATWTSVFPPILGSTPCDSGGGGSPAGNVGDIQDKINSSTFGAAHINDNGTILSYTLASVFAIPGTFTSTQMNDINATLGHSCVTATEYGAYAVVQPDTNQFATTALTGCLVVPVSSAIPVGIGVSGFVQNNNASKAAIGGFFNSRCLATSSSCWGGNVDVQDSIGNVALSLIGFEDDLNILNATPPANVIGHLVSGNFMSQPANAPAYLVDIPNTGGGSGTPGTGLWTAGYSCEDHATTGICIQIGRASLGASSVASQQISMFSTDSGSRLHQGNIYLLPAGNFDFGGSAVLGGANSGGIESDLSVVTTTNIADFVATGIFSAQPGSATGFIVNNPISGSGLWTNGFTVANGAITATGRAFQMGTLTNATVNVSSQIFGLTSYDSGGNLHLGAFYELPSGQILFGDSQGTGIAIYGAMGGYNSHVAQGVNAGQYVTTDPAFTGTDMLYSGSFANNDCVKAVVAAGVTSFTTASGTCGGVTTFNSRTGTVTPQAGDYIFNQIGAGTSQTNGNITITGWGTGASVTVNKGANQRVRITITAGTTPSANPTFSEVLPNTWLSSAPACGAIQTGGTGVEAYITSGSETTTNSGTMTWLATPTASQTYQIDITCGL